MRRDGWRRSSKCERWIPRKPYSSSSSGWSSRRETSRTRRWRRGSGRGGREGEGEWWRLVMGRKSLTETVGEGDITWMIQISLMTITITGWVILTQVTSPEGARKTLTQVALMISGTVAKTTMGSESSRRMCYMKTSQHRQRWCKIGWRKHMVKGSPTSQTTKRRTPISTIMVKSSCQTYTTLQITQEVQLITSNLQNR